MHFWETIFIVLLIYCDRDYVSQYRISMSLSNDVCIHITMQKEVIDLKTDALVEVLKYVQKRKLGWFNLVPQYFN